MGNIPNISNYLKIVESMQVIRNIKKTSHQKCASLAPEYFTQLTVLLIFLSWLHHYQQVTLPVMVLGEDILRICAFSLYKNRYSCLRLNLRGFKHDLQYSYALTSCVTDELIIYTHMRRAMIFYYHLHGLMLSLKSNLSTLQRFVFLTKCSESIMEITGINML